MIVDTDHWLHFFLRVGAGVGLERCQHQRAPLPGLERYLRRGRYRARLIITVIAASRLFTAHQDRLVLLTAGHVHNLARRKPDLTAKI